MKVYQVVFEYFFGPQIGYGTVRTQIGGIFSSIDLCLKDFNLQLKSKYDVKSWIIYEHNLDHGGEFPLSMKPVLRSN